MPDDPEFAPVRAQAMMQRDSASGSIYQVSRNYNFYGDTVALNVGDVLTVTLQESTRASKNAETSITKDNETTLPNPTILGKDNFGINTSFNHERDFEGSAEADQSNSLAGSITVTVTEVLPNGVLRIRGEKWLSLTNGDEYIRLTGLVRPQDIQPDNSVASTGLLMPGSPMAAPVILTRQTRWGGWHASLIASGGHYERMPFNCLGTCPGCCFGPGNGGPSERPVQNQGCP